MRDQSRVLRGTGRHADAQTAAWTARAIFTRLGAEGELRNLARQSWDEAFATELRGSLAPLHVAQELADAGRHGELLTHLSARSRRMSRPAFTGGSPSRGTISGSPTGSRGGWTTRSRLPTRRCATPSG